MRSDGSEISLSDTVVGVELLPAIVPYIFDRVVNPLGFDMKGLG